MWGFDSGILVPMMIFAIPIVAIAGGIMAGIVRTIGQQRIIEMAQRERIAALERGIDPSKLPALPSASLGEDMDSPYMHPADVTRRRARGLLVGGLVTLAVGVGLGMMLLLIRDTREENVWAVGLIPAFIGLALLLSSAIMSRAAKEDEALPRHAPPHA